MDARGVRQGTGRVGETLENTVGILERLVGFDSISGRPTHGIVGCIQDYLAGQGITTHLSYDAAGERANVFATIGPEVDGGVVLNGHTDVVPVDGQVWASDPFTLTRRGDRLYGRGSVDMKGFLACVLGSVPAWKSMDLKVPIHIAFSYDEETGGFGMPVLLDDMAGRSYRPSLVIVGEPTEMKIVSGHKGGYELRTEITGLETHSCNPLNGVSAISYAVRLIAKIEEMGRELASRPDENSPFEPPYATINIGTINGGTARNATAGFCGFDWELRPMPGEDASGVLAKIDLYARDTLLPEMRQVHPHADIVTDALALVPALDNRNAADAVAFICEITGQNAENVVSFGTDAGYFSNAEYSTAVFGPGSIFRAHKPDEYIEIDELAQGLRFLEQVGRRLSP